MCVPLVGANGLAQLHDEDPLLGLPARHFLLLLLLLHGRSHDTTLPTPQQPHQPNIRTSLASQLAGDAAHSSRAERSDG